MFERPSRLAEPDSIRAISTTRSSPVDRRGLGEGLAVAHRLGDRDLDVGGGRHLGEVRHHEHLMRPAQLGERIADRLRRRAADAGIDLVEHQRAAGSCTARRLETARVAAPASLGPVRHPTPPG